MHDSLKERRALPRAAHPVFSRILEGMVICGADLTEDKVNDHLRSTFANRVVRQR